MSVFRAAEVPGSPNTCGHISAQGDYEALRRRIALLEEASSTACAARANFEDRLANLERERADEARTAAQLLKANAQEVSELFNNLAVTVAELPPGRALRDALEQLRWLEDQGSGQRLELQQLLSRLDGRVSGVEKCVHTAEHRVGDARVETSVVNSPRFDRATVDVLCTKADNERFGEVLFQGFHDIRAQLEAKADRKDQDRLADALSQSCRNLTSTLRACRQDFAILEQSYKDLSVSVVKCNQDTSRLDHMCFELQNSFVQREQMLTDIEQHFWSGKLWGPEKPTLPSPRRPRPASGTPVWKPWPSNGIMSAESPDMAQQADNIVVRSADGSTQRTGTLRLHRVHGDWQGDGCSGPDDGRPRSPNTFCPQCKVRR